jgi:hypothetical protein
VEEEDGVRMISLQELERAGLWPDEGSQRVEAEIERLRSENEQLGAELRARREALAADGSVVQGDEGVSVPEAPAVVDGGGLGELAVAGAPDARDASDAVPAAPRSSGVTGAATGVASAGVSGAAATPAEPPAAARAIDPGADAEGAADGVRMAATVAALRSGPRRQLLLGLLLALVLYRVLARTRR